MTGEHTQVVHLSGCTSRPQVGPGPGKRSTTRLSLSTYPRLTRLLCRLKASRKGTLGNRIPVFSDPWTGVSTDAEGKGLTPTDSLPPDSTRVRTKSGNQKFRD